RSDDKFAYKFQWFNASGMEVSTSAQPWLEKIIVGGEVVYLSSVSPNPQCKDFKILMKELD
ncbi:MAG TPA: YcfL family protein, partial [Victivallales bacterium]|nr:YcfL family protein [Victivallales bacterium]